jgi:hypothetical protein
VTVSFKGWVVIEGTSLRLPAELPAHPTQVIAKNPEARRNPPVLNGSLVLFVIGPDAGLTHAFGFLFSSYKVRLRAGGDCSEKVCNKNNGTSSSTDHALATAGLTNSTEQAEGLELAAAG